MNIFILDDDLNLTAQSMLQKHLTKMPTEHTQLLCSAIHITRQFGYSPSKAVSKECRIFNNWIKQDESRRFDSSANVDLYLISHENHPCAIWARKSRENFLYLCDLNDAIQREYEYRGGSKLIKSIELSRKIRPLADLLPSKGLTPFTMAINPENLKEFNVVNSYRRYYNLCKRDLFDWGNRDTPDWIVSDEEAKELMIKYGLNNEK